MREEIIKGAKRVVIKVGSSVLASDTHTIDKGCIESIAGGVSKLLDGHIKVVLVTSGAIAAGMGLLEKKVRPKRLEELQAAAAVGQNRLMGLYGKAFSSRGRLTAQILLTREDFRERRRYLNAGHTLLTLLGKGIVPVVNENDTVSVDEIRFGDNDMLSSLVAELIGANLLIILSNVGGLYKYPARTAREKKGRPELIRMVKEITPDIERLARGPRLETTTGGMRTKIDAAKIASKAGISVLIADGRDPLILERIFRVENVGTLFLSRPSSMKARKRWIGLVSKPYGKIAIDRGAQNALLEDGRSLLCSGISRVEGEFWTGDIVSITDERKKELARGITNYPSYILREIKGLKTSLIKERLKRSPQAYFEEAVHRDDMAILKK